MTFHLPYVIESPCRKDAPRITPMSHPQSARSFKLTLPATRARNALVVDSIFANNASDIHRTKSLHGNLDFYGYYCAVNASMEF